MSDDGIYSPASPRSPDSHDPPSFYDSGDDDDDGLSANDDEGFSIPAVGSGQNSSRPPTKNLEATLSTYSLPRTSDHCGKEDVGSSRPLQSLGSLAVITKNGNDVQLRGTSFLNSPIESPGLDDLINELGWVASAIVGNGI
jgi:hypothetical protein